MQRQEDCQRRRGYPGDQDEIQSVFAEKEVRPMGRPASGIRGIKLKKGDEVIGMRGCQKRKIERKGLFVGFDR